MVYPHLGLSGMTALRAATHSKSDGFVAMMRWFLCSRRMKSAVILAVMPIVLSMCEVAKVSVFEFLSCLIFFFF
jgi:hypothetical protein